MWCSYWLWKTFNCGECFCYLMRSSLQGQEKSNNVENTLIELLVLEFNNLFKLWILLEGQALAGHEYALLLCEALHS